MCSRAREVKIGFLDLKGEIARLKAKKSVDSGLCDGYKDESGRISAPTTVKFAGVCSQGRVNGIQEKACSFCSMHSSRDEGGCIHQSPVPS